MEANYEKMLQDSNRIKNYIKGDIANLDDATLTKKENEKKWSALEVIEHLNKVYDIYLDNFTSAINDADALGENESPRMKRTIVGRLSIFANKPKGKKRRFKMKTFDFFTPAVAPDQLHDIIDTYLKNKETFNELIKQARTKDLTNVKVPTALGQKVKFYIPECFEFLIAHEERHMVQIAEAVEK
ncbi:DinB family protein [Ekhidna sp.]|uniref:DinB family protein n=1 Tax=Ekhidna sp. TaxID=2608089 RepID=UPI003515BA89